MVKFLKTTLLLCLIISVSCLYLYAQEEIAETDLVESTVSTLTGKISAVDLEASIITVEDETESQYVVSISAATTITKADESVALDTLIVGDSVNIEYTTTYVGDLIAQKISL